ncbi:chemotaxis protein CheW [Candidatus Margulisiibacteriota bacterium]
MTEEITLLEEDFYEKVEEKEDSVKLIVFRISNEWYGIDIVKSKEIINVPEIVYLPSSPKYIIGVINLRGNIVSITDPKLILGLKQQKITAKSRLIIIEEDEIETGLLVDELDNVIEALVSRINPTIHTVSAESANFIKGEFKIGDKLIGVLNTDQIILSI